MSADPVFAAIAGRRRAGPWRADILAALADGARFGGLFGTAEPVGCRVSVVLARPDGFETHTLLVEPGPRGELAYPALSPAAPAAFWYERALHDLFDVEPVGHPRLDPLLLAAPEGVAAPRPGAPDRPDRMHQREDAGPADVAGRGVFSIPFGPVRSGVTEAIEFLVETPGEDIAHLNIRPHYKHRGVAKAFEGRTVDDGVLVAERVEGIASVAHALAFSHAVESAAGVEPPVAAGFWRVVLAELERIVNHLEALARSTEAAGLAAANARLAWHKETVMRLVSALCGNRFGRGMVVSGGIGRPVSLEPARLGAAIRDAHERIRRDTDALLRTASFLDRVRGTGWLDPAVARVYGALGPIGRGSGFDDDDRRHRPHDGYRELEIPAIDIEIGAGGGAGGGAGDALARLRVRIAEIDVAVHLITAAVTHLGSSPGPLRRTVRPDDGSTLGWAEGPQGEELYSLELVGGRIRRCFARSASLHNLVLLHEVFHGDVLTDFPFIEASFGLCYAGVAM